jgi:hypothetical protein
MVIKNNLKKYILLYVHIIIFITISKAQSDTFPQTDAPTWSIGVGAGVTSLPSLQCTYAWKSQLAIRGEYDYMGYQYNAYPFKVRNTNASIDLETRLSRFVVMAHYTPFRTKNMGFLAGFAVFPKKTVSGTLHLVDTLWVGEAVITPEVLGTGQLRLGYRTVFAPYFGITIGRPIPAHKNGLRLDIGAYYGGKFAVKELNIDSNIFLEENESNATVLERNFNRLPMYYRLIPDIKLVWTHSL